MTEKRFCSKAVKKTKQPTRDWRGVSCSCASHAGWCLAAQLPAVCRSTVGELVEPCITAMERKRNPAKPVAQRHASRISQGMNSRAERGSSQKKTFQEINFVFRSNADFQPDFPSAAHKIDFRVGLHNKTLILQILSFLNRMKGTSKSRMECVEWQLATKNLLQE